MLARTCHYIFLIVRNVWVGANHGLDNLLNYHHTSVSEMLDTVSFRKADNT